MNIKPRDTTIKALFESSFLIIPRFQRPYSWDKENINDFWEDIFASGGDDYFLGAMVFFRTQPSSSELYVVDGQQRLLTITLLLCALRDILINMKSNELALGLQQVIERKDLDNSNRFVLFSENPYPFLQNHVQAFGKGKLNVKRGPEEENIAAAYADLSSRAQAAVDAASTPEEKLKTIRDIRDSALSNRIISIELDNENDAYLIFETINTRGKDLQTADLVKNHLTRLMRPTNKNNDHVRESWQQIQSTIGESSAELDINAFLVHHWISEHEYLPEKKLFKSLRITITKKNCQEYLDNIVEESSYYRSVFEPGYHKFTKDEIDLRESLAALSIFRVRQLAPFALALMTSYFKKKLSQKNTLSMLQRLENFHFKFTAVTSQRGAGGVALMYSKAARDLRSAKDENSKRDVCASLYGKIRDLQPDIAEFSLGFNDILFSTAYTRQRQLVRYILRKLHMFGGNKPFSDFEQFNIEHILPQSSGAPEEVIGSIGNMILMPKKSNENIANKPFAQKKAAILKEGGYIDPILKASKTWNANKIHERLEHLARTAYKEVWKL